MNLITQFRSSLRELKNLRSVILAAMLLAIHTVLSMFISIQVTESVRISVSFIANVITACLFGPAVGLINGALGDILQFLIKPVGGYFYGWTVNAALAGLVYGVFFYGRLPQVNSTQTTANGTVAASTASGHILRLLPAAASLGILLCWALAPFLTITEKASEENPAPAVLAEGTALQALTGYLKALQKGGGALSAVSKTAMMLAVLILAISILTTVLSLRQRHTLSLLLAVLTCFVLLLALYTDRKTMAGHWGFYLTVLLFLVIFLCHGTALVQAHALDLGFLIRTVLAVSIVCLLINGLLGTYWCSVMYGKHFMAYFVPRFVKNLIQIPINTVLICYLMQALAKVPDFRRLMLHTG